MNPAWSYEEALMAMAANQLGRRYGLATASTCMSTGGKRPDWQGGAQTMLISLSDALSPADMLSGAGSVHGNNVFSHAALLLDCEVFEMAARWAGGLTIADEDVALDVIEAVGPGGHFLDQDHTLERMRTSPSHPRSPGSSRGSSGPTRVRPSTGRADRGPAVG
jgi:trimethylamine---corrinoid protein Co-methyltransferase